MGDEHHGVGDQGLNGRGELVGLGSGPVAWW